MAMNYYNPYQSPGMGYNPPMQDQLAQLRQGQQYQMYQPMAQQPQMATSGGINWVQGEEGAKAFLVAAGNTVLLMDSEKTSFYLKSTDQSGMPLPLRIFDYTERTQGPRSVPTAQTVPDGEVVTRKEFDALAARVDSLTAKEPKQVRPTAKKAAVEGKETEES